MASALLAIAAAPWALNQSALAFVFKPLTTALIIVRAWPRGADAPAARGALRLGLLLSLLGDIALLWPQQGFLPGLIAFLLAHIAYIVAFTREHRFLAQPAALTSYALAAGAILALLWPSIPPGLRVPVACYVLALTAMSAQTAVVGLAVAGRRSAARPLADARRRVVHDVRRAAGHQQVRTRAAGGELVDPRHLLGRAVVHRVVAEAGARGCAARGRHGPLSRRPRDRARHMPLNSPA